MNTIVKKITLLSSLLSLFQISLPAQNSNDIRYSAPPERYFCDQPTIKDAQLRRQLQQKRQLQQRHQLLQQQRQEKKQKISRQADIRIEKQYHQFLQEQRELKRQLTHILRLDVLAEQVNQKK